MSVPRSLALAVAVVGAMATTASAAEPLETGANTAPAYPGNTVTAAFVNEGPIVGGTTQVVQLTGHAEFPDDLTSYTPSVFVQNADVDPSCGATLDQQRQKFINNTAVNASAGGSPWVIDEGQYRVQPAPGQRSADWQTQTQPFAIRTGVSQVLLCTYTRYVVDDVAGFAARYAVEQPACKPTAGKVRRGKALTLRCNFSGKVSARLSKGSKKVTRVVTLGKSQRARFSTKGARKGANTIAFSLDGKTYGKGIKVTVR